MKTIFFSLILIALFILNLDAQELSDDTKSFTPTSGLVIPADTITPSADKDTSIVRIGKKDVKVIDHENGTEILWGKDRHKKDKSDRFNGHWEGVEFGFNGFDKADYSAYQGLEFMSLNQGKSAEFNLNFYELNIGLAKSYAGLVSGMGLSFNSYRFENPFTLLKGANRTEPDLLDKEGLSKTKLAVSYLNVPLLLEFQIPVNQNEGRLFINAGLVGGVKIGSHTKVKYGDKKDKVRDGFNMNSFKYAATARIGYKDVSLFATYSLTPLFQVDKGPELTPFTIGISFLD
ncbi:MAG: outer membrane beta-barrel protein [Bacteroidota bacterium]|nr:hypothetical protein [Odoribacter sp.]MDP3642697.1 outer membrane beta-barrel protein [Bacteroidota bacterium]